MTESSSTLHVVLTGGGTAGHVMPNLALVPNLTAAGFKISYIGSKGIEGELVKKFGLPFYCISSGKLRRYASFENFIDLFRVVVGAVQAVILLLKLKPQVVFSKGGFVAVPVAVAAKLLGIPVVSHESDYTPGLANRIIAKFAQKLLYSFPETAKYIPAGRGQCVASPIRRELLSGDRSNGFKLCGFQEGIPVILVMGGSQGAQRLNDALLKTLPRLVSDFQIVHLTGKGKAISFEHPRYRGFEFLGAELKDVFSITDMAVCRSGANSIFELLALKIPMLLVPLEIGSRGDQVLNAKSFEKRGWAAMISESTMTAETFYTAVASLDRSRAEIKAKQSEASQKNGAEEIVGILSSIARH